MISGIQISSLALLMKNREGFEACVKTLTDAGVKYTQLQWIDPSVKPEEIGEILARYGMKSLGTQEKYDALVGRMEEFIKINRCAHSKDVCFSTIPERFFEEKTLTDFIEEMKGHIRLLKAHGMNASFHPTKKDFRLVNGNVACEFVFDAIEELKIVPDTNQLLRGGADAEAFLLKYKGRMDMIHFKDMVSLQDGAKLVPAGQGMTDFQKIVKLCKEVEIKYVLAEQETWEGDPFERMLEGINYINSIL